MVVIFTLESNPEQIDPTYKMSTSVHPPSISQGFPSPENVELSSRLESIVRVNGGVPATIGVLNGVAKVGFEAEELAELLSSAGQRDTVKVSRRDLAQICGQGIIDRKFNGGTTVAGTMILANLAGIKVFATGGLGGVHQGGELSMDISADLTELGRTPVALISSGCKSFLDIPRTLEYLETQGVGVATFLDGRTGRVGFPAFWTRDSGVPSPSIVQDEREAAAMIYIQLNLPLGSGLLFANPIPEEYSLPKSRMNSIMTEAIQLAKDNQVSGSRQTPFILAKIRELTEGATIAANEALVKSNVERGTKVAVELAKLEAKDYKVYGRLLQAPNQGPLTTLPESFSTSSMCSPSDEQLLQRTDVLVAGSLAIDLSCSHSPDDETPRETSTQHLRPGTSNLAVISQSLGGVGQNIATALHFVGTPVQLCTVIADDLSGRAALSTLAARGLRVDGVETLKCGPPTAIYVAFNETSNELFMAMADMRIMESHQPYLDNVWKGHLEHSRPKWLVLDANWNRISLRRWIAAGKAVGAKIAFEPVSTAKSCRIFDSAPRHTNIVQLADLITPNELELDAMWEYHGSHLRRHYSAWSTLYLDFLEKKAETMEIRGPPPGDLRFSRLLHRSLDLLLCFPCILAKMGSRGVLLTELLRKDDPRLSLPWAQEYILAAEGSLQNLLVSTNLKSNLQSGKEPTLGKFDILEEYVAIYIRMFPPELVRPDEIVSVNGVGDTFLGILLAGLAKERPKVLDDLVMVAQKGSCMTLRSRESVSAEISSLQSLV